MARISRVAASIVLAYLKTAARLQLAKRNPRIIGITGSAGKTSTLASIEAILGDNRQLKVSHKANSESGIPLNLLELTPTNYSPADWLKLLTLVPLKLITQWPTYDTYIVEMGIDAPRSPKNMSYLLSFLPVHTGIFLNAAAVHAQNFDYLAQATDPELREAQIVKLIAQEKGKLITSLPKDGLAVLYADDPNVIAYKNKTAAHVLTFGKSPDNTITIEAIKQSLDGTEMRFSNSTHESARLHLPSYLLPDHYAQSFAAALCVAQAEGIALPEAVAKLAAHYVLPPGRSTLIPGIKGSLILDSSYNASSAPTIAALELVNRLKPGEATAILGDMREIGSLSETEHLKVAQACLHTTKAVFLVGPQMKKFVLPFLHKHNHVATWHESALDAAKAVEKILRVGDIVLVKGSQNTLFLETSVAYLMRHKHKASELLCRQTPYWESVRSGLSRR